MIQAMSLLRLNNEEDKEEKKKFLFSGKMKPEGELDVIIDGLLVCSEDKMFDKMTFGQSKFKDQVYNYISQSWIENPNPMGALCKKRIIEHQKLVEFEEAYDLLVWEKDKPNKSSYDELFDYFKSCENRQFSKKRTPAFVYRMVQIRNNVLTNLADSISRTNMNGGFGQITTHDSLYDILLVNDKKIMQSVLLNNLLLLKSERLFGLEPTFNLNNLVYSDESFSKMLIKTLTVLYKENLYAENYKNADTILRYVEEQDFKSNHSDIKNQQTLFKTQYYLLKAKSLLTKNDLNEANNYVSKAYELYPYNPKIYEYQAEILFRSFLEDESFIKSKDEALMKEFFDSLYRMLLSNYQKYEIKVFSMILILFTLYSDQLTPIIKTLQSFFSKLPTNFLRVHFYEIALFFNDEVLKAIYERLCQSQLLEFYYILATFHFAVNAESQKSSEFFTLNEQIIGENDIRNLRIKSRTTHINMFKGAVEILTNYLPRQIFMLNVLGEMADSVIQETDLDIMMYIRVIIEEAYETSKVNKDLLYKLCNRENALSGPISDLRAEKITPEERFYKLIQLLDQHLVEKKDRIGEKIIAKELLDSNTIYFPLTSKNYLYIDTSNLFDEYKLSPHVKTVEHNDNYALSVDIFSRSGKKRKMLIQPKMSQNLIDNLLYDQLTTKSGELFMNDVRTTDTYPNKQQHLLFASRNWYCSLK